MYSIYALQRFALECKSEIPYVIYSGKRTAVDARRGGHCHGGLQVSLHSHADGLHPGGCGVGDARSGAVALRYFAANEIKTS